MKSRITLRVGGCKKTDIDQDSLETFEKRTLSASSPRTQKVVTTETFQFKPQVWWLPSPTTIHSKQDMARRYRSQSPWVRRTPLAGSLRVCRPCPAWCTCPPQSPLAEGVSHRGRVLVMKVGGNGVVKRGPPEGIILGIQIFKHSIFPENYSILLHISIFPEGSISLHISRGPLQSLQASFSISGPGNCWKFWPFFQGALPNWPVYLRIGKH